MKNIILLIFFILFFVGSNVLNSVGILPVDFQYFLLFFSVVIVLFNFNKKEYYKYRRPELFLLVIVLALIVFRYSQGILTDSMRNIMVLITTPIMLLLLPFRITSVVDLILLRKILYLVLLLFVVECGIGLIEYVFRTRIFLWIDSTFESHLNMSSSSTGFRSVALHGSPLGNALLITIINSFVITSSLKNKYKLYLWIIGFIGALCFNARIAMILNFSFIFFYFLEVQFDRWSSISLKLSLNVVIALILIVVGYLVFGLGFGDRLLSNDLLDESSGQKRIDIFEIFQFYDFSYFLEGISYKEFDRIKDSMGLLIVENFWICLIMLYGFVFVVIYTFSYVTLIKKHMIYYSKSSNLLILVSFILLASINNSLFTQFFPLLLFFICYNVFRPKVFKVLLPKKYLK